MSKLGNLFRQIRIKKNWSIRKAANKMGISYSYLSILEKGVDPRTGKDSNPRPETLKIISKTYNYPYEELMKVAGYLEGDSSSDKTFDLSVFVSNIDLIRGDMSIEKLSDDIYTKTGYYIKSSQIKSYLSGDIEPFPGTFNILCKYAEVSLDFWYKYNTPETLEKEKFKYRENLHKQSLEKDDENYIVFNKLQKDVRDFIISEDNLPYIKVAMEAQKKKLNPDTLKLLVSTIVNERDTLK
ncbi:helix-turn-helix transcriptional regulator [Herbivorax sp. ANBcel31]|uniref:helix-turn-helix domain-containing protein n=1 Tax=Herbivorax sp. ANBcel31 TaxID=3069754 RepID=UPI0027B530B5|nr:helix-turn-helix transcriptional regulator [Herbivorax sp. ANBcel31]MDQ2086039.1 helix-turn-helix transcriptional regulator [Herbivorax sp. ANBcel31]